MSTHTSYLGKTILLYFILVKRLLKQKPTIFQNDLDAVYLFNKDGIHVLKPSSYIHPDNESNQETWAPVDANESISQPARMLSRDTSPFFLVIGSSPKASRWQNVLKYRPPTVFWFMKLFTLAELIEALVF